MKRQGFILIEVLIGMILQTAFMLVLLGTFCMFLDFDTNAQQGFSAHDKGQMVISYFDSRIRNAGLGLWGCPSSKDIRIALKNIPALKDDNNNKKLCLPAALLDNTSGTEKLSHDRTGRFYSGNVLTLLYAHNDTHEYNKQPVNLTLVTDENQTPVTLVNQNNSESNDFFLIDNADNGLASYSESQLGKAEHKYSNIKSYAVMENVGVPVFTENTPDDKVRLRAFTPTQPTIYPMTEMLNLECQRVYTLKDSDGYCFVFRELNDSGNWGDVYYHTRNILDLYMTLDTRPNTADKIPIFELRVLIKEGYNENGMITARPKDWPGKWTDEFSTYKVHVSKASWKLYNLAHQFR